MWDEHLGDEKPWNAIVLRLLLEGVLLLELLEAILLLELLESILLLLSMLVLAYYCLKQWSGVEQ